MIQHFSELLMVVFFRQAANFFPLWQKVKVERWDRKFIKKHISKKFIFNPRVKQPRQFVACNRSVRMIQTTLKYWTIRIVLVTFFYPSVFFIPPTHTPSPPPSHFLNLTHTHTHTHAHTNIRTQTHTQQTCTCTVSRWCHMWMLFQSLMWGGE